MNEAGFPETSACIIKRETAGQVCAHTIMGDQGPVSRENSGLFLIPSSSCFRKILLPLFCEVLVF